MDDDDKPVTVVTNYDPDYTGFGSCSQCGCAWVTDDEAQACANADRMVGRRRWIDSIGWPAPRSYTKDQNSGSRQPTPWT